MIPFVTNNLSDISVLSLYSISLSNERFRILNKVKINGI